MCDREYSTFYGKNKHERSHGDLNNVCEDCGVSLSICIQITDYIKKSIQIRIYLSVISVIDHSQPIKCLSYIANHTKQKTNLHVIHVNIRADTQYNLEQHQRGAHGPG